eukprot:3869377-Prymnesium_polylepis.1
MCIRDSSYAISLEGPEPFDAASRALPADWIVDFSAAIFGNRWARDEISLRLSGRACGAVVHSDHDRRYLWAGTADADHLTQYGRGACAPTPIACANPTHANTKRPTPRPTFPHP